ncbi:hypothetical protein [Streptomyces sp. NPDC005784]|uniref:hypothetical protein n=1 Tax=Streptomyces sp. NPDC005784 TaxID=3364731 RepID=UPI0036B88A1C
MTVELPRPALLDLPGVRAQVGDIAADLTAGLNCLWLLPDQLVDTGQAEELFRTVLHSMPDRLDVSPPTVLAVPAPRGPGLQAAVGQAVASGEAPWTPDDGEAWGDLPDLDFDDGFDIGWSGTGPVRTAGPAVRDRAVPELFERLGKELAVGPSEVVTQLSDPGQRWRPVIGLRAWAEPDDAGQGLGVAVVRGGAVQRLFHSLSAAVKDAGLPPQARPRLLVVARLGDVPAALINELDRDIATSAVHWWWGTIGRLDTATVVAADRERGPAGTVRRRVLAAVREEVVTELAAFDLVLARRLAGAWDGKADRLGFVLRSCLDGDMIDRVGACPRAALEAGTQRRPGSRIRSAWALGLVQSWEGRLRRHPAAWYAEGASEATTELQLLVGQAQQRVLFPWVEDTRERLARLGIRYASRPLEAMVEAYAERPPANYRTHPEKAFEQLEVGALLTACYAGALALPDEELRLLKELVKVRNILAHRGALHDATLGALCDELALAHRRWVQL